MRQRTRGGMGGPLVWRIPLGGTQILGGRLPRGRRPGLGVLARHPRIPSGLFETRGQRRGL
eukprot:1520178-Prorocentrum_lima.AAC.1